MAKSELILALEQIEREKGIKKDDVLKMIEGAVVSSLRKHVGKDAVVEASIDPETAEFRAAVVKKVAETVANPELEISLGEAKLYKRDAAVGEDVRLPAPAADFARIAAQTAKQVLTQKIREVERDNLYEEFKPKEGEIVTGSVHRFLERNIIVDLGKTEAILPIREQIRRERYAVGNRVRAAILRVDKAQRGPQVVLSRAAPLFLRRLFELEVPEIGDRIVEIVEVARDPGFRAKVAVKSNDPKVDAVGSCVGIRGSRIRSIMNELSGERIDLIAYSPDLPTYLSNSLAPAKVSSVRVIDGENKKAEILVSDEQLSLAIGKDGQNIRLAARLTGWELEIKSEGQRSAEAKAGQDEAAKVLAELEGVGPKTIEILVKAGFTDISKLAQCKPEELMTLQGIGEKTAAKIIASAKARRSG
ncbi:MAG: transcription termination/antitermination protein NusA [Elusimicrobia bacterium]|nr:transcription termination/antitermination protein NusA [Elusimicrobiota bacterium]